MTRLVPTPFVPFRWPLPAAEPRRDEAAPRGARKGVAQNAAEARRRRGRRATRARAMLPEVGPFPIRSAAVGGSAGAEIAGRAAYMHLPSREGNNCNLYEEFTRLARD